MEKPSASREACVLSQRIFDMWLDTLAVQSRAEREKPEELAVE